MTMAGHYDLVLSFEDELVQRVQETRRLSKALLSQGLLSENKYCAIVAAGSPQDRMKLLLQDLSSRGQQGSYALYRLLQEYEPDLTLQMEHALYVHMAKKKFIHRVKRVEPVAKELFTKGLIEKKEYFQVCEKDGSEERMQIMFQILEQHGLKETASFYTALFLNEPLLYRELEKERVLQMNTPENSNKELTRHTNEEDLRHRWEDLLRREMEFEKQREELRREKEKLLKSRAEIENEKKKLDGMKSDLERRIWQWRDVNEELNSHSQIGKEEQRIMGELENLNNNGIFLAINGNSC